MRSALETLTAVSLILSLSSPSGAAFYDGNKLLAECADEQNLLCIGFIIGVADTYEFFSNGQARAVCLPPNVTVQQIRDVAANYLNDHPDVRHYSAESIVLKAWMEAFPC